MASRELTCLVGTQWFIPEFPGKGVPVFGLKSDPLGRSLLPAYSTREKCELAIREYFQGASVVVEDDVLAVYEGARSRGHDVALDLHSDGEHWDFTTFESAMLSPGGDA